MQDPYTGIGEANAAGLQAYMAARPRGRPAGGRTHRCRARAQGVAIDTVVVENHQAAKSIVEAAKGAGADLIVMGSHRRSGLAKLVLGSVAAKQQGSGSAPIAGSTRAAGRTPPAA